jgi:hypothetical protein
MAPVVHTNQDRGLRQSCEALKVRQRGLKSGSSRASISWMAYIIDLLMNISIPGLCVHSTPQVYGEEEGSISEDFVRQPKNGRKQWSAQAT